MGMTKSELSAFIKAEVAPMIERFAPAGKDIAQVVRENVEASLAQIRTQAPSGYAGKLFASEEGNKPKMAPGTAFARCLRATAAAKMMGAGAEKAIDILKSWGDVELADKWAESRSKALGSGDPTAGGFLVPPQFSSDVIELLRPAAVVRSLGPQSIPMPTGSINVPKLTQGATASYIGENANAPKSEERFGQIKLTFKKQACLVPISNDLIRYSSPSADAVVRDDVVRAMATREDKAFIRDDGTSGTPKGLKNWISATNKLAANATVSLANVTTDLGRMVQAIMAAEIPLIVQQNQQTNAAVLDVRPGWIMSPRTYRYLTTVQTTTGAYAFRDEMLRGTLWGWPYRVTTQVLETYTAAGAETGGTQSELYFGAFAHAVIGEALGVTVDASQEAAYYDGTQVVASFSQDQTVVRVLAEHDFALRHDRAFALLQNMTWGI
jgi:HK97 family phage major capsid protein